MSRRGNTAVVPRTEQHFRLHTQRNQDQSSKNRALRIKRLPRNFEPGAAGAQNACGFFIPRVAPPTEWFSASSPSGCVGLIRRIFLCELSYRHSAKIGPNIMQLCASTKGVALAKKVRISKSSLEQQTRPDLSKQMAEVQKLRIRVHQAEARASP